MTPEMAGALAQFGTAGLMGWLWLTERRSAADRERQLDEAHARLMQDRRGLEIAVEALRENTRVLAVIESGQRAMTATLAGVARRSAVGQAA